MLITLPSLSINTCPGLIDDVIPNDVRTISKISSDCCPELSKAVPEAISVVVEALVGNTSCLRELVQTPVELSTILDNNNGWW